MILILFVNSHLFFTITAAQVILTFPSVPPIFRINSSYLQVLPWIICPVWSFFSSSYNSWMTQCWTFPITPLPVVLLFSVIPSSCIASARSSLLWLGWYFYQMQRKGVVYPQLKVRVTVSHLILEGCPLAVQWSRSVGTGLSSVMGSDLIHTCEIGKEKSRDGWSSCGIEAAEGWSCRSEPNHWGVVDRADEPVLRGGTHSPPCLFWRSRTCSTCHSISDEGEGARESETCSGSDFTELQYFRSVYQRASEASGIVTTESLD